MEYFSYSARGIRYAERVCSGEIPAGQFVRLACQRHLDDLQRVDWEYHFEPERGDAVCSFIEDLPHVEGTWETTTIRLEDWQCFLLTGIFGWVDEYGFRRFRKAYLEVPRKNAKTTIAAGVALFMLLADGELGAKVYSAAVTREQAGYCWSIGKRMVDKQRDMQEYFGVRALAHAVTVEENAALFKPLSRDALTAEGLNPHCVIVDELHAHKTREVWDVMNLATGSRRQSLIFAITTAGDNKTGVCYEQHEYVEHILRGRHFDETYFGLIYSIDGAPYDVMLQSLPALRRLENSCTCDRVDPILIDRYWQEACANAATTDGIVTSERSTDASTSIDQSGPEASAEAATSNGYSTITPNERPEASRPDRPGLHAIEKSVAPPMQDGGQSQALESEYAPNREKSQREQAQPNIELSTRNKTANAEYAKRLSRLFASITVTAQALSGDSSAGAAIVRSAFSETLRRVYFAHSDTCGARSATLDEPNGCLRIHCGADDWTTEASMRKANPNYGSSVIPNDIKPLSVQAQRSAASQNSFMTKRLNVWVSVGTAYFNMLAWRVKCVQRELKVEDFYGERCIGALDLASTNDVAAKIRLFKREGKRYVFAKFYLPESAIEKGNNPNYDVFSGWAKEGLITLTEGDIIDFEQIEEDLIDDRNNFRLVHVGYDPFQATELVTRMLKERVPMKEVGATVRNMSQPMKTVGGWIIAGQIFHTGDPVLDWMIGNVYGKVDYKDNVFPRKTRNESKIDGAVCLIMAAHLDLAEEVGGSVYDSKPMRTI